MRRPLEPPPKRLPPFGENSVPSSKACRFGFRARYVRFRNRQLVRLFLRRSPRNRRLVPQNDIVLLIAASDGYLQSNILHCTKMSNAPSHLGIPQPPPTRI